MSETTGPEGPPAESEQVLDPARGATGGAEAQADAPIGFTADVGGEPPFVDDPEQARRDGLVIAPDQDVEEERIEHDPS